MTFRVLFFVGYLSFLLNFDLAFRADGINALIKSFFLIAAIVYVATRPKNYVVLVLLAATLALTTILAMATDWASFSWDVYLRAVTQYIIPFLLLAGIPDKKDINFGLVLASWVPLLALGLGLVYQVIGVWSMFSQGYTGVPRLQGSTIPAFLGGFAMAGAFAAGQYASLRDRRYAILAGVNMLILVATAARMPVAIAAMLLAYTYFATYKDRGSRKFLIGFGGVYAVLGAVAVLGGPIIKRFSMNSLSGRELLWNYLEGLLQEYGRTGIGFGHAIKAVPRSVYILTGSAASHNDFLRIAVELGYVGSFAFFGMFIGAMAAVWLSRRHPPNATMLVAALGYLMLSLTDNALATPPYFTLLFVGAIASYATREVRSPKPRPSRPAWLTPPGSAGRGVSRGAVS